MLILTGFDMMGKTVKAVCDPVTRVCYPVIQEHWEKRYKKRFPRHAGKLLLLDMLLLLAIGALTTGAIFARFIFPAIIPPPSVNLKITAPQPIISGSETTFELTYKNATPTSLGCAEITIDFGAPFMPNAPRPTAANDCAPPLAALSPNIIRLPLGSVEPAASASIKLSGRLFAPTGTEAVAVARLNYWAEAGVKPSSATAKTAWKMAGSRLALDVSMAPTAFRGQPTSLTVSFGNAGTEPLNGARLSIKMPDDFIITGMNARPAEKNTWILPEMQTSERDRLAIYGFSAGRQFSDRPNFFTVTGYLGAAEDALVLETAALQTTPGADALILTQEITRPFAPSILTPGQKIEVTVRYANKSRRPIKNVRISLSPAGDYIETASPAALEWTAAAEPKLAAIEAGAAGSFTAELSIKDVIIPDRPTADFRPALELVSRAEFFFDDDAATPIYSYAPSMAWPISTKMSVVATALYYSQDNEQLGRGPVPPRIGMTTKYRVFIAVANTTSAVDEASLEAVLPPGVEWTGLSNANAGETIDYLPLEKKIRWKIGKIPAYAAATAGTSIDFELALTPGAKDVGTIPLLLEQIKITGVDRAAGARLVASSNDVTTLLPFDPKLAGKGAVIRD